MLAAVVFAVVVPVPVVAVLALEAFALKGPVAVGIVLGMLIGSSKLAYNVAYPLRARGVPKAQIAGQVEQAIQ